MNVISTPSAPKPVAAYSQAVEANGFVFCAGQLGIDPQSGKLADGVAAQAEQALRNISAVLEAAGSSFAKVVKISIYMKELGQFATVNEIYARFVGEHRPARTTTGASELPAGALIEIDAIAAL
jgi:2-iminobutanoate/2-iminopropanoate deaminase